MSKNRKKTSGVFVALLSCDTWRSPRLVGEHVSNFYTGRRYVAFSFCLGCIFFHCVLSIKSSLVQEAITWSRWGNHSVRKPRRIILVAETSEVARSTGYIYDSSSTQIGALLISCVALIVTLHVKSLTAHRMCLYLNSSIEICFVLYSNQADAARFR